MAKIYTVKSGDSISIIARDVLGDIDRWPELAYMNQLVPPYIIRPGMILAMPRDEPLEVTVTKGQAAPMQLAQFSFNPATMVLFAVGAALVLFMMKKWYRNQLKRKT